MSRKLKVLLGGVPFGRDNIGDESILENVVKIVREQQPDAEITVSTDDGDATSEKLGVETVELFGFAPTYSRERMRWVLENNDVFIWSGATGLSDYPEIPVEMMRIAQRAGRKTVLWGVGMNENLNPAKYKVLPGKRRTILRLGSALTLGILDLVAWEERRRERRARSKIGTALAAADLAALRDPESVQAARKCGALPDLIVGADSALIQEAADWRDVSLPDALKKRLEDDNPKVGICISAQREVENRANLIAFFDRLVAEGNSLVLIPMNPVTDLKLMAGLKGEMERPEGAIVIEGIREPGEITAIAGRMDCVISSRLHLLILASTRHVPVIGISRGSKVDNFLRPFGLEPAGSVEDCDFDYLYEETMRLMRDRDAFQERSRAVREDLLKRLDRAQRLLKEVLR